MMVKKVLAYLEEGKSFYACTQEFNISIDEVMNIYYAARASSD